MHFVNLLFLLLRGNILFNLNTNILNNLQNLLL